MVFTSVTEFQFNIKINNYMYKHFFKRVIDFTITLVGFILISPIFLVLCILVRCKLGSPIFFPQIRIGKDEKPFKMLKFRTMTDARDKDGNLLPDNERFTKFGNFMRNASLDELPELVNVIKGDMSLVGPRPERPQYVEKFREEIPRYMIKHQVRPGMTGWAQVNGYRGDTSIRKRIEHDLYYIENWTLGLDIKILFLTVFKGFINKNAY